MTKSVTDSDTLHARLVAMLRECETSGTGRDGDAECPICGGKVFHGEVPWAKHRPDCKLAALLSEVT